MDVLICGKDAEFLIGLTENGLLFWTQDQGASWVNLSFTNNIENIKMASAKINRVQLYPKQRYAELGLMKNMIRNRTNKTTLIVYGRHGKNYISKDCGRRFEEFKTNI
jgi:hypothetical protein